MKKGYSFWLVIFLIVISLIVPSCSKREEKIIAREATQELIAQDVKAGMDKAVSYDKTKFAYTVNTGNILQPSQALFVNNNRVFEAEHITNLLFSFDGDHIAFVAKKGNKVSVLVDEQVIGQYDNISAKSLVFSPGSSKIAYDARIAKGWIVAVYDMESNNYTESDAYDDVGSRAVFSPDGKRTAYNAKKLGQWIVILDGEEQTRYDDIGRGSFTFSPDNKHFAYGARIGSKWIIVQDGKKSNPFDSVVEDSLLYSFDGSHFAYAVANSGKQYVVFDGNSQKEYKGIASKSLTFSPDGKRFGYAAYDGDGWFVVVDGKEDKKHKSLYSGPVFSRI